MTDLVSDFPRFTGVFKPVGHSIISYSNIYIYMYIYIYIFIYL